MKAKLLPCFLFCIFFLVSCGLKPVTMTQSLTAPSKNNDTVRARVIGGMTMTGLWAEISKRFEAKTGYKVVVVSTGPRPDISEPFRRGKADLLVMHSGDITSDLVADGYGINMRPCAKNDLVILGPPSDPAGIMGMKDGAQALRKIYDTKSTFLDGLGVGPRELCNTLWKKIHVKPVGDWVIKDSSDKNKDMLIYASEKNAYLVFGRMPVLFEKVEKGNLKIMVEGDPAMRRPYIVMEANPKIFPDSNDKGARALSDFMLSKEIQDFMNDFGRAESGLPWFYPVWPYNT